MSLKKNAVSCAGFTLIETVVVIAITSVVFGTLGSLLVYFYQTNAHVLAQATATAAARRGVEDVAKLLREATPSDSDDPIEQAATSSVTFYADVDNDETLERVHYALDEGVFTRLVGIGSDAETTILATGVINDTVTPLFTYLDDTGTELPTPIPLEDIVSIKTTLVIEVSTNHAPASLALSSVAMLRNAP